MNKYQKQSYDSGICAICCKRPRNEARTTCDECASAAADRARAVFEKRKIDGLCVRCGGVNSGDTNCCLECMRKKNEQQNAKKQAMIDKVYEAYGGVCNYCGDDDREVLTIDHVNDDGKAHRDELGTGWLIYPWAIKNNFPDRLQILCGNCQLRKLRRLMRKKREERMKSNTFL